MDPTDPVRERDRPPRPNPRASPRRVRPASGRGADGAGIDYARLFEGSTTGMYVTTPDGTYLAANRALARMFGYASPERLVRETRDLGSDFYVERDRRAQFMALAIEHGSVAAFESEVRRRDGARIWVSEHATAVRDRTGRIVAFEGTTVDVTDRRRAEAELLAARAELEARVAERTVELEALSESLRELTARERVVLEQERTRIAREVHDELGQSLTALAIDLAWLRARSAADARAKVEAMEALVAATVERVQRIASELRPGVLDAFGLAAAAEWQVDEFARHTGLTCTFDSPSGDVALDGDCATALFRILQESLTNIARHAAATRVEVALRSETTELVLSIRDDGRGIGDEEAGGRRSLGLLGMRERAAPFGGVVRVAADPGGGTTVTARVPLPRARGAG